MGKINKVYIISVISALAIGYLIGRMKWKQEFIEVNMVTSL